MVATSPWGWGRYPLSQGLGRLSGCHACAGGGRVERSRRRRGKVVHAAESIWTKWCGRLLRLVALRIASRCTGRILAAFSTTRCTWRSGLSCCNRLASRGMA
eukprot:2673099-Prorocentrum_lima.AAC.1